MISTALTTFLHTPLGQGLFDGMALPSQKVQGQVVLEGLLAARAVAHISPACGYHTGLLEAELQGLAASTGGLIAFALQPYTYTYSICAGAIGRSGPAGCA